MSIKPNDSQEYTAHYRRIERYVLLLEQLYGRIADEAVRSALLCGTSGETPFSFADYPQIKAQIDSLFAGMAKEVESIVVQGANLEWTESNAKNDRLASYALGIGAAENIEEIREKFKKYFNNHQGALSAFLKRKEKGLGLSDKVWRLSEQYKADLELALSVGIADGKSAADISRDVRKYLQDPDKLFRRVREKFGDKGSRLILSKNAKAYHPGNGLYRSSYKNAMRLTRTEINMAYHRADYLRWREMDFVVGIEVKRSRKEYDCSVCDALKGKYPKDFYFPTWHPQCRCQATPILKTKEEFLSGGDTSSVNEVRDVPQGFKDWINDNIHRAKSWNSTPYFIKENPGYIPEKFKVGIYSGVERSFVRKTRTSEAMRRSISSIKGKYQNVKETELGALHIYTQSRVNGNYREINRILKKGSSNNYVDSASHLISSGLSKLPKVEGIVYRGTTMSMKKLSDLYLSKAGQIVDHPFFTSASQSFEIAKGFTNYEGVPKSHKRIIFDIQSKNGRDIGGISEFNGIFNPKNQKEVLFDKGSKYFVSPEIKESDGYYYIKLIEQ